jgi:hypothetical protein
MDPYTPVCSVIIKIHFEEMECDDVDCIHLTWEKENEWLCSIKDGEFLD